MSICKFHKLLIRCFVLLSLAVLVPFLPDSSSAFYDGDLISVSRVVPSYDFTYGPLIYPVPCSDYLSTAQNLSYIVEDTSIEIDFGQNAGSGGPFSPFGNYLFFQDISSDAPLITGFTYETDMAGITADDIVVTPESVTVGIGGLNWPSAYPPNYLKINLQFAPVPEPSSLAVLLTTGTSIFLGVARLRVALKRLG